MSKLIKRITLVSRAGGEATTLYKAKRRKKKGRRFLEPAERSSRRLADAMSTFGKEISRRHRKSNRKRRDGWLRDGQINLLNAQNKAARKLWRI